MPTDRPPKVSVAIPVYNGEPHLAEAIDSVLSQTFADFELVICDDHSQDDSCAIAAQRKDPRVRLLTNHCNLGLGGNWNRCLSETRGDYIKILPQDDLLHPDCLMRQVAVLNDDTAGEVALTFCARAIIGPDGRSYLRRGPRHGATRYSGADIARMTARSGTNPIGEPGAVLFRRSAARTTGRFDGTRPFVIDIDYWLRLLRHGSAAYLPDVLASFRISRNSQSVRIARRQAAEFRAFLDDVSRSGTYALSRMDLRIGGARASLNGASRALLYRLALRTQR